MPDKTICDTCYILSKLSKTCHKPKKIPPCPLKSMLNFGGFVDRLFRDMNNIVRWGKGRECFETSVADVLSGIVDLSERTCEMIGIDCMLWFRFIHHVCFGS